MSVDCYSSNDFQQREDFKICGIPFGHFIRNLSDSSSILLRRLLPRTIHAYMASNNLRIRSSHRWRLASLHHHLCSAQHSEKHPKKESSGMINAN